MSNTSGPSVTSGTNGRKPKKRPATTKTPGVGTPMARPAAVTEESE